MNSRMKQKKKTMDESFFFFRKMKRRSCKVLKAAKWLMLCLGVFTSLFLGSCQNENEMMDDNARGITKSRSTKAARSIIVNPITVNLDKTTGAEVEVTAEVYSLVSVIGLKAEYNIDASSFPGYVLTGTHTISIKWNAAGAPDKKFTFVIRIAENAGEEAVIVVNYDPNLVPKAENATISPSGVIPDEGGTYSCTFKDVTYKGDIDFRARKNDDTFIGTTGTVSDSLKVVVPTSASKGEVIFEISLDGGASWITVDKRVQVYETFGVGRTELVTSQNGNIPVGGSLIRQHFNGTLTAKIIVKARTIKEDLASGVGYVADGFIPLLVPYNSTGADRIVYFGFSKDDGKTWQTLGNMTQLGK